MAALLAILFAGCGGFLGSAPVTPVDLVDLRESIARGHRVGANAVLIDPSDDLMDGLVPGETKHITYRIDELDGVQNVSRSCEISLGNSGSWTWIKIDKCGGYNHGGHVRDEIDGLRHFLGVTVPVGGGPAVAESGGGIMSGHGRATGGSGVSETYEADRNAQ